MYYLLVTTGPVRLHRADSGEKEERDKKQLVNMSHQSELEGLLTGFANEVILLGGQLQGEQKATAALREALCEARVSATSVGMRCTALETALRSATHQMHQAQQAQHQAERELEAERSARAFAETALYAAVASLRRERPGGALGGADGGTGAKGALTALVTALSERAELAEAECRRLHDSNLDLLDLLRAASAQHQQLILQAAQQAAAPAPSAAMDGALQRAEAEAAQLRRMLTSASSLCEEAAAGSAAAREASRHETARVAAAAAAAAGTAEARRRTPSTTPFATPAGASPPWGAARSPVRGDAARAPLTFSDSSSSSSSEDSYSAAAQHRGDREAGYGGVLGDEGGLGAGGTAGRCEAVSSTTTSPFLQKRRSRC